MSSADTDPGQKPGHRCRTETRTPVPNRNQDSDPGQQPGHRSRTETRTPDPDRSQDTGPGQKPDHRYRTETRTQVLDQIDAPSSARPVNHPAEQGLSLGVGGSGEATKNYIHFSICACHPSAGAMLILSVSFFSKICKKSEKSFTKMKNTQNTQNKKETSK